MSHIEQIRNAIVEGTNTFQITLPKLCATCEQHVEEKVTFVCNLCEQTYHKKCANVNKLLNNTLCEGCFMTVEASSGVVSKAKAENEAICFCNTTKDNEKSIRCDECEGFFHLSCVGLSHVSDADLDNIEKYICPFCSQETNHVSVDKHDHKLYCTCIETIF